MDFWDLTKLIFRRWKIALPLLLVTIAATGVTAAAAKPDYVMTSYVQLIPATISPTDNPTSASARNPWNQLGLNTLGQASIYATQDQKFLDSLKAAHHTENFSLTMTYPDPIVTVQVVGKTPQDATETAQLVIKRLRDTAEALQRQAGVRPSDMIATQRLDQGENLKPSGGKVKRAIIAVAVAGLLLTGGITVLFDAVARRRARRREQHEKANPVAVELALAREAAAPATNGQELPVVSKVPADRTEIIQLGRPPAEPVAPTSGGPAGSAPAMPASSAGRTLQAGTYRSVNAAVEPESPSAPAPPESAPAVPTMPADVTIVLQPEWVTGENGNKRH